MEEKRNENINQNKKIEITPVLAKIVEQQLNKCLKKGKVPSRRLLDTIEILKKMTTY